MMKVFEIGVAKTGTTSLGRAYEILGFKHKAEDPDLYLEFIENYDYEVLYEVIDKYDAFQDGPWHNKDVDYKILDKKYPNSKFIILERDDESWIRSNEKFYSPKYHKDWENWEYSFLIDDRWVTQRESVIEEKLTYKNSKYLEIKEYFKDRQNDLLVMNICDGQGWEVLCPFLGKEIPNVPFPKLNVWEENDDYN
tara:strand:- start:100 stop:684 length:585 start_codon:yes stop_codon:yes gene_type:complete